MGTRPGRWLVHLGLRASDDNAISGLGLHCPIFFPAYLFSVQLLLLNYPKGFILAFIEE